ncbi:Pyridoxal phosphate phosphatase-related protein [Euphorbia peplus]|nr:Pyridoxal phosphate phosphatase-related protein [Euphorbia peplus]
MAGTVVVFDFDRTLIDDDSDRWVVTRMGLTSFFNHLRPTLPWNSLMDRMMKELHLQGKTPNDIVHCLNQMPLHPRVTETIKSIHALGCDLRIVSDANQFFIEKILDHHGLLGCFSQITTNPASVDDQGRVRISPYHDFSSSPHDCRLCPSNLCKGMVVEKILVSTMIQNEKKRFIYLGDGRNDFCPCLKLGEGDYVMPRKEYPLWDQLCSKPSLVKAKILEWSNGEELADTLLRIVNAISAEESIKSSNCNNLIHQNARFPANK